MATEEEQLLLMGNDADALLKQEGFMRVVNNLVENTFNLSSIPNRKKVNIEKASTINTAPHNDHGDPTALGQCPRSDY